MSLLKFKKGLYANLPVDKAPGTVYITTDEKAMYVDIDESNRIRIGQIITLASKDLRPPFSTESFYYITDLNALARWDGTKWVQLNNTDSLTSEIAGVKGRVATLEGTVTTHGEQITALQGTVGDATTGLVKDVKDLQDEISKIVTAGGEPNTIEKITVGGVPVEIKDETVALGALAGLNEVDENHLKADLKEKINNIKATAEAAVKQSDYEIDKTNLNNTISGINAEITGVKDVIGSGKFDTTNTITKYAAGVDEEIAGLKTHNTTQDNRFTVLEETKTSHAKDITKLKEDVIAADTKAQQGVDDAAAADAKAVAAGTLAQQGVDDAAAAKTVADRAEGKADTNAEAITGINGTIATLATKAELTKAQTELEGEITTAQNKADTADGKADANALAIQGINATLTTQSEAIAKNATDIGTNATEIAKKANITDVNAIVGEEGTLTKRVAAVESAASTNAGLIRENATAIGENAKGVQANVEAIAGLRSEIGNLANVMNFRGAVIDTDSVVDPQPGDVVIIISTGVEYVYDTTNGWVEFGNSDATSSAIADLDGRLDTVEGRITALEETVGDATKGLVKTVADHGDTLTNHGNKIDALEGLLTWGSF